MRIRLLVVPGCPGERPARERIAAALAGLAQEKANTNEVSMETVEVRDEEEARALGMAGSPTILVDGVDPFADHTEAQGAESSLSCRLYRGADGTVDHAPGVEALRAALSGGCDCCDSGLSALVGRGGKGRAAPAERGLRAVHQAVLRHFAETGRAPGEAELAAVAAAHGRSARDVLAELAREDFLTLDDAGGIRAAYPFSAAPTVHRVRIDEVEVWSMCAIDALGIPSMLGRDLTITSTDPVNGAPVTVNSRAGKLTWEPPSAVVFAGMKPGGGTAAEVCCQTVGFFSGPDTARAWSAAHPDVPGEIIGHARAEELAATTFGPLLAD
ncbi:alkylmercury lyase family protein [Streptomyces sp. TRM66268-LWL]|uniref:Alkylmercury lyase family protein n=1 Tax=Streptomyces polyasparticus TaxID=2767826 RepID=A0ABR7SWR1_9ACTN|nr:alkylmercury lyase family protein [Streptomyces polyasparticus]MBC9718718.1 alkylmercury lyase family protein [Streptomyces polyasparticus]